MDGRSEINGFRPNIDNYLYECCGFGIVIRVMYGGKKECTAKVLIIFSEWVLWVVGDE